jgi:hypothetical protein
MGWSGAVGPGWPVAIGHEPGPRGLARDVVALGLPARPAVTADES